MLNFGYVSSSPIIKLLLMAWLALFISCSSTVDSGTPPPVQTNYTFPPNAVTGSTLSVYLDISSQTPVPISHISILINLPAIISQDLVIQSAGSNIVGFGSEYVKLVPFPLPSDTTDQYIHGLYWPLVVQVVSNVQLRTGTFLRIGCVVDTRLIPPGNPPLAISDIHVSVLNATGYKNYPDEYRLPRPGLIDLTHYVKASIGL